MNLFLNDFTNREYDYLVETIIPLNKEGDGIVLLIDHDIGEITNKKNELFEKLNDLAIVEFYERGIINLKTFKEMNKVYRELTNGSK